MIVGLVAASEALRAQRETREARQREWETQEARRREAERRLREEDGRIRALDLSMRRWRKSRAVHEYAALLFCRAFGWARAGNSAAGHDATDAADTRYQIKARRPTRENASRQVSALRMRDERLFDVLAGVMCNEDYTVARAALVPHATVLARSAYSKQWNG